MSGDRHGRDVRAVVEPGVLRSAELLEDTAELNRLSLGRGVVER